MRTPRRGLSLNGHSMISKSLPGGSLPPTRLIATAPQCWMRRTKETTMGKGNTDMTASKIHEAGTTVDFTVQFDCEAFGQTLKTGDEVSVLLAQDWNEEDGQGDGGPFGWGGYSEETLFALGTVDTHFDDRVTAALFSENFASAASCEIENSVGTLITDEISGDMSGEAAVRIANVVGGWIRCSISTCVKCHDADCIEDQHEILPLVKLGEDVLVSCEKCGSALHRD